VQTLDRVFMQLAINVEAKRAEVDTSRAAACPVCASPMNRVRIEAAACDIDACSEHGTWFDAGELRAVSRVYENVRKRGGRSPGSAPPGPDDKPFGVAETEPRGSPYALGIERLPDALADDVARYQRETDHVRESQLSWSLRPQRSLLDDVVDFVTDQAQEIAAERKKWKETKAAMREVMRDSDDDDDERGESG
jgi:hypothetical protein